MPIAERDLDVATLPLELKAEKIVELRRKGLTYAQIARELRVSTRDIARVLKTELRRNELQDLKERVDRISEEIRALGGTLGRISAVVKQIAHGLGQSHRATIYCFKCHRWARLVWTESKGYACERCGELPSW